MKMKPSLGDYFKLPNPGLRAYFKHTEDGNSEDYRPPFWKGESREEVLNKWLRIYEKTRVKDELPALFEFELDMKSKVGPMSIQLPLKDRLVDVENYFTMVNSPSEPILDRAITLTSDYFVYLQDSVRMRSRARVIQNMRLSTNCGNPWFGKRRSYVKEALQCRLFLRNGEYWLSTPNDGDFKVAAVLGWRGQEGGISLDDVKQRVIWMMSFVLNIHELAFYQPCIEAVQHHGLIPAYVSMDAVDKQVTQLFATKGANDDVICTDFSKFDQHFNRDMQNAAFKIEDSFLTRPRGVDDYAIEEGTLPWDELFYAKFKIPIICSEDIMYTGEHGMGSGSGGTNFDECMAHKALQFEAAIRDGRQLNPYSMAYGDDGILTYKDITAESVIQTYVRHGQEMNISKQYVSKHDCVVLRRWHGTEYVINNCMVGVYSTFRALGRLLAQERFYDPDKWSGEMVTLRALSILENCKWHPLFEDFVKFVMTGDKFRLGLDLPGFYENLETKARKAIEEFQDFLGYTKNLQDTDSVSGINEWRVVKYVKSLK